MVQPLVRTFGRVFVPRRVGGGTRRVEHVTAGQSRDITKRHRLPGLLRPQPWTGSLHRRLEATHPPGDVDSGRGSSLSSRAEPPNRKVGPPRESPWAKPTTLWLSVRELGRRAGTSGLFSCTARRQLSPQPQCGTFSPPGVSLAGTLTFLVSPPSSSPLHRPNQRLASWGNPGL